MRVDRIKRPCFLAAAEKATYPKPRRGDARLDYKLKMDWPDAPPPLGHDE